VLLAGTFSIGMRIAQITDIHIALPNDFPHGIDSRAQFREVMAAIREDHPDVLVISGDLCNKDPDGKVYAWIAEQLADTPFEIVILAGNHDSQESMSRHFEVPFHTSTKEIYHSETWEGNQVFFLDTGRGAMSDEQYQWLRDTVDRQAERLVFFMHHPPLYCGVPHMDTQYAFREIARFQELLATFEGETFVYCGHYHVEREIAVHKQIIHITPSTFFQINAQQVDFAIDHHRPGYRIIELTADCISSKCRYVKAVVAGK
jgi:Icc protein